MIMFVAGHTPAGDPLLCKTVVIWACPDQHCCVYMRATLLLDGLFNCEVGEKEEGIPSDNVKKTQGQNLHLIINNCIMFIFSELSFGMLKLW